MKRLTEVFRFYLNDDTDNALLITGPWGVGKTYYYRKVLQPMIPEITEKGVNYTAVTISVFGLSSMEAVRKATLSSLNAVQSANGKKFSDSVYRIFSSADTNANTIPKSEPQNLNAQEFIKPSSIVFCFDDVERINEKLEIDEFIGFINLLTDATRAKVVLIINEDQVRQKDKYHELKEKVTGNTLEFIPDSIESLNSIISSNFNGTPLYQEFLLGKCSFILSVFFKHSKNLRTLTFALNYFKHVFLHWEKHYSRENESELSKKKDQIYEACLRFTLSISIEYKEQSIKSKEGQISYGRKNGLDASPAVVHFENVIAGLKDKNGKIEPSYRQEFRNKYYEEYPLNYFGSIYDFLTGGNSFDFELLLKELKTIYNIDEQNQIQPQYAVLQKLHRPTLLSDEEYLENTKILLNYAEKGCYPQNEYLTIFYYLTRFKNPLDLDVNEVANKIVNGLRELKTKGKYIPGLRIQQSGSLEYATEYVIQAELIVHEAIRINQELLETERQKNSVELEKLYYSDFLEFCVQTISVAGHKRTEPALHGFNVQKLYEHLKDSNSHKSDFTELLRQRYSPETISFLVDELPFLEKLKEYVSSDPKLDGTNVSGYLTTELNNQLEEVIRPLKELRQHRNKP